MTMPTTADPPDPLGFFSSAPNVPPLLNSEMNYQQRNRALFECIRERCERTGNNLKPAYRRNADFISKPFFYI
jgi:hypothetical protein